VEGFYPSLAQQYAQDVGSSLNRTGQRVIDRSLNRPPTLTQRGGYPVTVQLGKAISFQQPPKRSSK
jgi:type IV secretory pathway VirB10-like protein